MKKKALIVLTEHSIFQIRKIIADYGVGEKSRLQGKPRDTMSEVLDLSQIVGLLRYPSDGLANQSHHCGLPLYL